MKNECINYGLGELVEAYEQMEGMSCVGRTKASSRR